MSMHPACHEIRLRRKLLIMQSLRAVGLGGIRDLVPGLGTRCLVLGTAADARYDVVAASAVLLEL